MYLVSVTSTSFLYHLKLGLDSTGSISASSLNGWPSVTFSVVRARLKRGASPVYINYNNIISSELKWLSVNTFN